jgi:hypothetical protein
MRRKLFAGLMAAAALSISALAGAGPAFAGEIRGPSSPTGIPVGSGESFTGARTHANSICAFSGLNHFHAGVEGEFPTRTQSYGQFVRLGLKDVVDSPGEACNGRLNPLK